MDEFKDVLEILKLVAELAAILWALRETYSQKDKKKRRTRK